MTGRQPYPAPAPFTLEELDDLELMYGILDPDDHVSDFGELDDLDDPEEPKDIEDFSHAPSE